MHATIIDEDSSQEPWPAVVTATTAKSPNQNLGFAVKVEAAWFRLPGGTGDFASRVISRAPIVTSIENSSKAVIRVYA